MSNVTLAIEDELLREARKVAIDRDTSVNQLVREFLADLVRRSTSRQVARDRLLRLMDERPVEVGPRTWSRDDLHER
jgi:hypothetical protein